MTDEQLAAVTTFHEKWAPKDREPEFAADTAAMVNRIYELRLREYGDQLANIADRLRRGPRADRERAAALDVVVKQLWTRAREGALEALAKPDGSEGER